MIFIYCKISNINKKRRQELRILATPNNDDSSRGYLQITINLKYKNDEKKPKLVFFDMPGSENTVRITQEFLGLATFKLIEDIDVLFVLHNTPLLQDNQLNLSGAQAFFKLIHDNWIANDKPYSIFYKNNNESITARHLTYFINNKDNKLLDDSVFDTMFKELIISTVDYGNFSSESKKFILTATAIAPCAKEITLFFNQETCTNIFHVEQDKKIKFLKDEHFKSIVQYFLKKVIFQKSTDHPHGNDDKAYYFKYFKLKRRPRSDKSFSNLPNIEDNDRFFRQITRIYGITYSDMFTNKQKQIKDADVFYNSFSHNILQFLIPGLQNLTSTETYTFANYEGKETNVMILLFMYLLYNATSKYEAHNRTEINKEISTTQTINIYRILIIYVYKYVKFIIDQGSAIVTTLEHLKYFFLSNINKIDEYNRIETERHTGKAMTLYDTLPSHIKNTNLQTQNSILNTERIYITPTTLKISDDAQSKTIVLQERVNCGNMSYYKLLSILQKLKNEKADLTEYTKNDITKLNLQSSTTTKSPALFIMLAHIKCYSGNDKTLNELEITKAQLINIIPKICTAESDTLEFIQSVSSTSQDEIIKSRADVAKTPTILETQKTNNRGLMNKQKLLPNPPLSTQPLSTQPLSTKPLSTQHLRTNLSLSTKPSLSTTQPLRIKSIYAKGGSVFTQNKLHKLNNSKFTKQSQQKFDFSSLYTNQHSSNKYRSNTIKKNSNNKNKSIFKYKSKKNT